MPRFKSHLGEARRASEADFQRALSKASAGSSGGMANLFGGNSSGMARAIAGSRENQFDDRELESHFRNQCYTSIRPIAQRIAGQPIRLAKIAAKPKGRQQRLSETRQCGMPQWVKHLAISLKGNEDFQIIDQHQILDALNRPAPSLPGWNDWMLKYTTTASLELCGVSYWWMPVVKGRREIHVLPSSWCRPNHENGLFGGWFVKFMGVGEEKPVPAEEIAPFWLPDPSNPIHGLGPLEAGAKSIMVEEFVIEAQKRAFQLGVNPGALITVGDAKLGENGQRLAPRLKKWQTEQIIQAVKARWGGLAHWGEPLVLDRLISDVKPYGNKPKEMDFGTNAESAKARVEQIFGVNPYITGAAGLSSRAESAESDRHFVGNTVNPKIELLSRVMTIMVLPLFDSSGQYVLFIEPARSNDAEMEQKEWDSGLKNGAILVDEYRTNVLRLAPLPNGKGQVAVLPTTMQYVAPGTTPATSPATTTETPDEQGEAVAEGDEADKSLRLAKKSFDDAFYDDYAETWLKSHGDNEQSMQDAILAFFADQSADVVSKLDAILGTDKTPQQHRRRPNVGRFAGLAHKASADGILSHVFEPNHWVEKFKEAIKPSFAKTLAAGAKHELDAFSEPTEPTGKAASMGFDFGVDLPAAVKTGIEKALTEAFNASYWAEIQQTTKDQLAKALQDGLDAGEHSRGIAKRVKDVLGGDNAKERAATIARSETTNAMGAGQHEARLELADEGVIDGKEWFSTYDGVTRPTHATADGQQRGVDEDFEVGGHAARWPGDSNLPANQRINCRCASASVTAFSKRTRAPHVKSASFSRGCEIHGRAA